MQYSSLSRPIHVVHVSLGAPCRQLNSWLLDALAALAARPALVERLFVSTRGKRLGVYTLQLFVGDRWTQVTIDDRLPTSAEGSLLFARRCLPTTPAY